MVRLSQIHPLTDFLRNHKDHVRRLKRGGQPEVLTIHGKAQLVIQDAESYQQLLESLERAEAIAGIREGLESMERGEGIPLEQFAASLRRRGKRRPKA